MYTMYVNVLIFFIKCLLVCQSWNSLEDKIYLLSLSYWGRNFCFVCSQRLLWLLWRNVGDFDLGMGNKKASGNSMLSAQLDGDNDTH